MAMTIDERAPNTVSGAAMPASGRLTLAAPRIALGLVLLISAGMEFAGQAGEGYANSYYAAGIKSMLTSWHNFFFVSFDAGGFVSLDKPPLGLWIEAASARVFGFSGFSMLLPEALAGVISVGLLYLLVARVWGPVAALLAALGLAVTPISVVTDRNNTIDSLLIMTLLLAAWSMTMAAERGQLRMLLLTAVVIGLGFNIKMLQAYLVLPGFALMYLLGAPIPWRKRCLDLLLATGALLVVSLSWATIVDLTPAGQRPFVSDSGTNSELSLTLGYNGLGRFTQALFPGLKTLHVLGLNVDLSIVPAFASDIGNPGWFRLLTPILGTQVGWLLPLALMGLAAAAVPAKWHWPVGRQGQSLLLWGGWLAVAGFFFSTARFYHLYYLVMLAPPIAALAGIGMRASWRLYRARGMETHLIRGLAAWLLPAMLLTTAGVQISFLNDYPAWGIWLNPLIAGLCLTAALVLAAGRLNLRLQLAPGWRLRVTRPVAMVATAAGLLALIAAPTTWAAISLADGNGSAWLPQAGPSSAGGGPGFGHGPGGGAFGGGPRQAGAAFGGGAGSGAQPPSMAAAQGGAAAPGGASGIRQGSPSGPAAVGGGGYGRGGGGAITFAGSNLQTVDAKLIRYLRAHQGGERFLVATMTSTYASLFILQNVQPVIALGGYQGWDRIVDPRELAQMVAGGTVRYFYLSPSSGDAATNATFGGAGASPNGGLATAQTASLAQTNDDLAAWVVKSCRAVPVAQWQTTGSGASANPGLLLYDCAAKA